MSKGKTVGGIIMIVFGSILLALGVLFAFLFFAMGAVASDEGIMDEKAQEKVELFKRNALETVGEITEIDRDASTTKIAYQSEIDNADYVLQLYTVFDGYSVGDSIVVYYDIDDPSDAIVTELYDVAVDMVGGIFFTIGIVASCVGAVGLILLIVGIVLLVKGKKQNQRNEYNASTGNYQNGQF